MHQRDPGGLPDSGAYFRGRELASAAGLPVQVAVVAVQGAEGRRADQAHLHHGLRLVRCAGRPGSQPDGPQPLQLLQHAHHRHHNHHRHGLVHRPAARAPPPLPPPLPATTTTTAAAASPPALVQHPAQPQQQQQVGENKLSRQHESAQSRDGGARRATCARQRVHPAVQDRGTQTERQRGQKCVFPGRQGHGDVGSFRQLTEAAVSQRPRQGRGEAQSPGEEEGSQESGPRGRDRRP